MDTLIHADIFFFISSIGFILLTAGVLVLIYFAARAVKRFEEFTELVEAKLEDTKDEVSELKDDIRESFLYNMLFGKKAKKKTRK